ncbi:MAG TPA: LptA/OstA family protein [Candidatus Cloacimonadota bacterium]|nr:LptA/OstA family protein [Candidatus Cloacimonadota bacterium]
MSIYKRLAEKALAVAHCLTKIKPISICIFAFIFIFINIYAAKAEQRAYRLVNADNLQMNKYSNEYITNLRGNVVFYYGKTQFKADHAEIYEQQKTVILKGNVRIKEDTLTFYSDTAYYYRNDEYIKGIGNCTVREDHSDNSYRELKAKQIEYYRERGDLQANNNVSIYEQKDNIRAKCGYAQYNLKTGYGYLVRQPLVWQLAKDDSLSIKAEKIELFKDIGKVIASFDVETRNNDMRTESDFLVYYYNEGRAIYLGQPLFFTEFGDANAENVTVYIKDNKVSQAVLQDSCKIVFSEEKGMEKKNWIIGDKIIVNWENDKLKSFTAMDNVSTFIWQDQKKKQLPMHNAATSDLLDIIFNDEQKVEIINLKSQVKGKYAFKRKK